MTTLLKHAIRQYKMIIERHQEKAEYYRQDDNALGVKVHENYAFDFKVRLAILKSFDN